MLFNMLSGLLQTAVSLYPDFTLTANSLSMAAYGKTVQLSMSRNAANALVVDINGEIWTIDLMGLFMPAETLGLTFEQYASESRMDLRNWFSWTVFAVDIILITAAVSSGGLPFAIAPLIVPLVITTILGINLYLYENPIGLLRNAKDRSAFDSEEQRKAFETEAARYLETLFQGHLLLLGLGVIGSKSLQVIKTFKEVVGLDSLISALSSSAKALVKIPDIIFYLATSILSIGALIKIFLAYSHSRFLLIDLGLTIGGIRNQVLGLIMKWVNLVLFLYFGILRPFFDGGIDWLWS
ncbi:MAG: hypothetical protein D6732_23635 [Methanobacteriota archaeon]|nr:MAG: hypothetical protein D6732_23635 [Euryarchaeota archaeon]